MSLSPRLKFAIAGFDLRLQPACYIVKISIDMNRITFTAAYTTAEFGWQLDLYAWYAPPQQQQQLHAALILLPVKWWTQATINVNTTSEHAT